MSVARTERAALVTTLRAVGPDAPTLCEGWTTRDLTAHMVVREHRLDAAPGILVPFLADYTAKVQNRVAAETDWDALVDKLAAGPPLYSPLKLLDPVANVTEMFVHHEDVRRGGGDNEPRPESDIGDLEERLWGNLRRAHILMTRSIKGVRVVLETPGLEPIRAGKGDEAVTISGRPGEVVLFLLGRRAAAQVDISGSDAAQAALSRANLGI